LQHLLWFYSVLVAVWQIGMLELPALLAIEMERSS